MAILQNKGNNNFYILKKDNVIKAQEGKKIEHETIGNIDTNTKPLSDRLPYRSKATKAAPYLSTWLQDPITIKKMNTQFGEGVAGKMNNTISGLPLFDMRKLGTLSDIQLKDFTYNYNKKLGIPRSSSQYMDNFNALKRMQHYGNIYKPKTGTGVLGVRIPGFKGVGTVYDVMNPDEFGTATHELTHATGYQPVAEKYIYEKWGNKQIPKETLRSLGFDESDEQLNYLRDIGNDNNGEGVYPRIMQLRKLMNVKPGQKVTPEMLKAIDFNDKASPLRGLRANWNDETILDILNTVAGRNNVYNNNELIG